MIATDGMRTVIDLHTRRPLGDSGVSFGPLSLGGNAPSNPYVVVDAAPAAAPPFPAGLAASVALLTRPVPAECWRSASGAQAGSMRLTEARS